MDAGIPDVLPATESRFDSCLPQKIGETEGKYQVSQSRIPKSSFG